MKTILLVEDKESLATMLRDALTSEGYDVEISSTGTDAIRRISRGARYLALITDLKLPGADGLDVLRRVREEDPDCPVIVMTGYGTIDNAVEAMKLNAIDFVEKPLDLDRLSIVLARATEQRRLRFENLLLREEFQKRYGLPLMVGDSPEIRAVSQQIQKVAATESTVLLQGESGTGKELFARAIHRLSPRSERAFIAVNCAAIPDTLIENELFGHEKGAYTGAASRQLGKFEMAEGGTVFLDEIGELGHSVQAKLLRIVQEREFERLGGSAPISADVRILCATNRNLEEEVRDGRFREDLFFRINVFPVTIPPLRARRSDIGPLIDHFIDRFRRELGRPSLSVTPAAREVLERYDWPGNVRELQNCIERAAILSDGGAIDVSDVAMRDLSAAAEVRLREALDLSGSLEEAVSRAAEAVERIRISDALKQSASRAEAAALLGITTRALAAKIRELGLPEEGAKP